LDAGDASLPAFGSVSERKSRGSGDQASKMKMQLTGEKRVGKVASSSFPDRFRLSLVA
jgi:hypothetical protein